MADIAQILTTLGGFGAGYNGQGAQYLQGIQNQKILDQNQQDRKQQLDDKRKAAMVQDAWTVNKLLDQGKAPVALKLLDNRIEHINKLKGDPSDTVAIKEALVSGDPARVAQAKQELQTFSEAGIAAGAWAPPVRPEDTWEGKKFAAEQGIREGDLKLKQRAQDWKEQHPNEGQSDKTGLFGAPDTVKDEAGNLFKNVIVQGNGGATTRLLPIGHNNSPVGNISVVGQYGLTAGEKVGQTGAETDIAEKKKQSNKLSEDLYGKINTINTGLQTFQQGIDAIDSGANTGVVQNLLPSLKASTIELDNVKRRLGADVLTSGIFGIASERDVKTAFDMAAPPLAPQDLKKWLVDRQQAQAKVRDVYEKAIDYLAEGNTIADLQKLQRSKRDESNLAINKEKKPDSGNKNTLSVGKYQVEVH